MNNLQSTNIANLMLGVKNILNISEYEETNRVRFFVEEAIRDVLSIKNKYRAKKTYTVDNDNTFSFGPEISAIFSIDNLTPSDWELTPGKVVILSGNMAGQNVNCDVLITHIDDECNVLLFDYQDKAVQYRAAYQYAATNPAKYGAVVQFLKEEADRYCRAANSQGAYLDFIKNKEKIGKWVNWYNFSKIY